MSTHHSLRQVALMLAAGLSITSCATRHEATVLRPAEIVGDTWAEAAPPIAAAPGVDRWWTSIDSPDIAALVDQALRENMDLAAAWARIAQLDAVERQARSGLLPTINLDANVARTRVATGSPAGNQNVTQYSLGLSAAYEIDLWGRVASGRDAAGLDRDAVRADVEATALVIAASTVDAWLELVYQRERRSLLEAQIATNNTYINILGERLRVGRASALEILQQQQQIDSLSASLPLIDAAEALAAHRLSVLLGREPGSADRYVGAGLPEMPPFPSPGVPADVLARRPDVRAAGLRLAAADARVAVAAAARLPSIRIGAGATLQASNLTEIVDDVFWNLFAGLTAPLFQGGRLNAEVDRTRSVVDERLAAYASTLLTAAREVEDAVALERSQHDRVQRLESSATTADHLLTLALDRYQRGAADYLSVISAISGAQRIEQDLLDARRALWTHRVALYRALGGDWTTSLSHRPAAPEET